MIKKVSGYITVQTLGKILVINKKNISVFKLVKHSKN